MNKGNPMKKDRHTSSRLLALLLCLPIALCAAFSMMAMAQGEIIDIETYNGVVILEDPALIGDVEDGETTIEPTTIPTEAPSVEPTQAPSIEPTQEPTQAPTDPPVVNASYEIIMDAPSGWYLNRAAMEVTTREVNLEYWTLIQASMCNALALLVDRGDSSRLPETLAAVEAAQSGYEQLGDASRAQQYRSVADQLRARMR